MLDLNAALVAIAVSAALGVGASAAEAAPKEDAPMDFSHVTSRAKAKALVKKGELVEIYLFAIRLGGPEAAENTGFVPPGALGAIESAEDRIIGMIKRKAVNRMRVRPGYRGKSVVPARIDYIVSGKQGGEIEMTVEIW